MLVFFTIYIFCSFLTFSMPLILIACDFVSMYPSHSQKRKKYLFCHWVICWANVYYHLQPSFFRPGELKTATSCRKHLLTVAMATGRSSIKVPCENEDLPDKENAPDFDEDTLRGELCSTSASVIVRTISIPPVSRM